MIMRLSLGLSVCIFTPSQFPLAKEASAWTYNLTAGDVLFIHAGTPHAVRNVGHTVAYSYNLVDQHNLDYHIKVNLAEDNEWPIYSQGQIKLFEFIANVAELPLPTVDEEPLGEYYKRQHPLTVINIGDNRRKWHAFSNIPASISFEKWYNDEVRIPDSICVDDNVNCDTWMHDGECNNNGWMLHHCRRACGACDMDPKMIPSTLAHAPEGLMCHDRFTKCTTWAREGSCETESEVEWMTKHCPRACNKCHHGTAGCSDFSSNCRQWARQGQCEENREFMMQQCCSSCALLREGDDKPLYS